MADFSISYDIYCVTCTNLQPSGDVAVSTLINYTGEFDAGSGTPNSVTAIISDGSTVAGTITSPTTFSFDHTFASTGNYSIVLQFGFADTPGTSDCESATVTVV